MKRVVVLGAGISGLTLARQLSRKGHSVAIYEKEGQIGGLSKTLEYGGQLFDLGPHEFCTNNPVLLGLLSEVLGADLLVRHKSVAQYFMGDFLDYPIRPLQVVRKASKSLIARTACDFVVSRLKNLVLRPPDRSFKGWVENRFGTTLYRRYFGPYTRKVWGIDPDRLDPTTASDRIAFKGIPDLLLKTLQFFMFGKEQYESSHNPLKSSFYYARGGIGTLLNRLHQECLESGCEMRCNWEAREFVVAEDRVVAMVGPSGEVVQDFDIIISTAPLTQINNLLGRPELNDRLSFRSMIFCFLEIPRSGTNPFHWIYFPEQEQVFQRITDFSLFDAAMSKPGHTALCAEIACFEGDPVWKSDDDAIVGEVVEDLVAAGVLRDRAIAGGWIRRERHAYPMQVNRYRDHVTRALSHVMSVSNLVTTGRQGLYKYCNMDECMEMALNLAESVDHVKSAPVLLDSNWRGAGVGSG
ncbi:MAG: FAD-dependent oxidoreductase [Planctomycetota bacterium]